MLPNFWDPYTYADTVSHGVTKFSTVSQRRNRHVFTLEHAPQLKGQETIALIFFGTRYISVFVIYANRDKKILAIHSWRLMILVWSLLLLYFVIFFSVLHYKVTAFVSALINLCYLIRSTSKSRPNNIRGGKCPSVRPSVRPQKVSSIWMKFGV